MTSALYKKLPHNTKQQLTHAFEKGLSNGTGTANIFFRADDIGAPGKQFDQLIELFQKNGLPLCLAVVPTWLTPTRFTTLQSLTGEKSLQWCWHQHGWLHRNHETEGKKQEFGPARPASSQILDLKRGRDRLRSLMGNNFAPFFTPPWNRCSIDSLNGLESLGFKAVSRSKNAKPVSSSILPDLQINIDLHTRKETDPETSLNNLLKEIEQGLATGTGGVMIHHQLMNREAFQFLNLFFETILSFPSIKPLLFEDLL
ncbi:MAG: polysaccharide deacetylase family protein [Desulfocapsa sp.]|nr:polysaccharide deacetylase family protein [Desulfocapsa sp.]